MKRTFICLALSVWIAVGLVSCSSSRSRSGPQPSGLNFRAFISNPVFPTATGGGVPVLEIIDASNDTLSTSVVSLESLTSGSVSDAGMMVVSPKKDRTLVFSPKDNKVSVVSNSTEATTTAITLPGPTESMFVWTDNVTAFAAVPSAPVTGQPAGAIERMDISSGSTTASIPVPAAHYIVPSPNGNQILVFSDNLDTVTLITPSLIGSGSQSSSQVPCSSVQVAACVLPGSFDRPVWAVFNASGTTAYVMNCGAQCGGTAAGPCLTFSSCTTVSVLDMTQVVPVAGTSIPVPAATFGLLQGNTLFVAGTPLLSSDNNCSSFTPATAAAKCGRLSVVNVSSLASTPTVVAITDGYHDRMQMGSNGQLFIGSRNCTNVNVSGGEVRGCLGIVNASSSNITASSVKAPPQNGDVTGVEPVPNRNVVYVCQGGTFIVYDTTTDKQEVQQNPPNVIGQPIDVKMVEF